MPTTGVYHTHTFRCQHATGEVVDYARAAAAAGLARLGAADHTPLPDGRWGSVRMRLEELPAYEAAVAAARREVPELRVLQGMECDVGAEYFSWYRDTFLARGYDYLIASVHFRSRGGELGEGRAGLAGGCCGLAQRQGESSAEPGWLAASMRLQLGHASQQPRDGPGLRTQRLLAAGARRPVAARPRVHGARSVHGGRCDLLCRLCRRTPDA